MSIRVPATSPVTRKTFKAALIQELRLHIPTLGELTATPLAARIEELVDQFYPRTERLRIGQIVWPAVDEGARSSYGKRIENTALKPVILDLVTPEDIEGVIKGIRRNQINRKIAIRLFRQAKEQGGVLTGIDVSLLLGMSPHTVYRWVTEFELNTGEMVPRRGTIHDIGLATTHKRQICHMVVVQHRSIEETAFLSSHSVEAVTRYVQHYRRVYACLSSGLNVDQTAFATGFARRLVREYKDLQQEHRRHSVDEEVPY